MNIKTTNKTRGAALAMFIGVGLALESTVSSLGVAFAISSIFGLAIVVHEQKESTRKHQN